MSEGRELSKDMQNNGTKAKTTKGSWLLQDHNRDIDRILGEIGKFVARRKHSVVGGIVLLLVLSILAIYLSRYIAPSTNSVGEYLTQNVQSSSSTISYASKKEINEVGKCLAVDIKAIRKDSAPLGGNPYDIRTTGRRVLYTLLKENSPYSGKFDCIHIVATGLVPMSPSGGAPEKIFDAIFTRKSVAQIDLGSAQPFELLHGAEKVLFAHPLVAN